MKKEVFTRIIDALVAQEIIDRKFLELSYLFFTDEGDSQISIRYRNSLNTYEIIEALEDEMNDYLIDGDDISHIKYYIWNEGNDIKYEGKDRKIYEITDSSALYSFLKKFC